MPEFDSIILFAKAHIIPILLAAVWYFLAGALAAISGKRSQIEAWCAAHPRVALVLNLLRATGFDYLKVFAAIQNYVRFRAGLPPATLLVLLVAVSSALSTGCINRSVVQTKVQQALVFEDKVHTQVVVLETVFESAVQFLPADKRAEATAKLEQAELILQQSLDAKDNALQAALEASSEQVDLAALVPPIIKAIESIIAIVADVRSFAKSVEPRAVAAMPNDDVIEVQREKLRVLAGAMK